MRGVVVRGAATPEPPERDTYRVRCRGGGRCYTGNTSKILEARGWGDEWEHDGVSDGGIGIQRTTPRAAPRTPATRSRAPVGVHRSHTQSTSKGSLKDQKGWKVGTEAMLCRLRHPRTSSFETHPYHVSGLWR